MASTAATTSHFHLLPTIRSEPRHTRSSSSLLLPPRKLFPLHLTRARAKQTTPTAQSNAPSKLEEQEVEVEVEEDMPWIQEKALDLVDFTGTVSQAVPGPRIGHSRVPWLLAVPLAYVGLTFLVAFVKTVRKFTSPKAKLKRMASKNKQMLKSIDDLFAKGRDAVSNSALKRLSGKIGFSMQEIVRKYIRYALNEKFFTPDLVVDLIHLRKESMLKEAEITEILNEISRRIVKKRGPVLMTIEGFTKEGFKRKLAVNQLFGKILYLSELPEFCSRKSKSNLKSPLSSSKSNLKDPLSSSKSKLKSPLSSSKSSLIIKEIFGVTDEDADSLRFHPQSERGDMESAQKMLDDSESDTEEREDSSTNETK